MKNKIIIKVSLLVVSVIILLNSSGCKTEQSATTKVYKIDSSSRVIEQGIVYALPKTCLDINIEVIRNIHIPGPYHEYAEKLLGVSNVNQCQ